MHIESWKLRKGNIVVLVVVTAISTDSGVANLQLLWQPYFEYLDVYFSSFLL